MKYDWISFDIFKITDFIRLNIIFLFCNLCEAFII